MKRLLFLAFMMLTVSGILCAQSVDKQVKTLQTEVQSLKSNQASISANVQKNKADVTSVNNKVNSLNNQIDSLESRINSLKDEVNEADKKLTSDIDATNETVRSNEKSLSASIKEKSLWALIGICILAIAGGILYFLLRKRMSNAGNAIDNIKSVQEDLKKAQKGLEEESVKLDSKLVEILEKQMTSSGVSESKQDHSLALKVADEIARIKVNLSRMDSSVKGYKQLSKAVERIKDNFLAKGYEIVDMIGQPYNEGMKVIANFVPDESLPEGAQIITGITKPQVLFKGEMIQSAEITVSQNI